jgi:hypothetical protein
VDHVFTMIEWEEQDRSLSLSARSSNPLDTAGWGGEWLADDSLLDTVLSEFGFVG